METHQCGWRHFPNHPLLYLRYHLGSPRDPEFLIKRATNNRKLQNTLLGLGPRYLL